MSPNDADGIANSVDPDQTAPLGAVWSGSALFAQAYLSENLGSLRYTQMEFGLLVQRLNSVQTNMVVLICLNHLNDVNLLSYDRCPDVCQT